MNDRFRNLMKAHDHIVKGRSKEVRKVFIPHWGYVFVSSDAKYLINGQGVIMKPPCRECQFREVGCHSKCESYIQWRVQLDKYNEQKNIQNDACKYIRDNVRTIRHRMRKLKGYSCTVRD